MKEFVLPFNKLGRRHVSQAGGKGANLGELTGQGVPVPPGFVVLRSAFDRFIRETDIIIEIDKWLHQVNPKDMTSIDRASHTLRDVFRRTPFPSDLASVIETAYSRLHASSVAVRSSATAEDSSIASWAGELESFMFITKKNLLDTVKTCWSSLFTPRAIFYRFEKKLHRTPVSVAVVVQAMVNSEVSGITFTVHPVSNDHGQMVIEAGWGQGESIVSGAITPDTYIFDRVTGTILDINVSEQRQMIVRGRSGTGTKKVSVPKKQKVRQKLTGAQITHLAALCQKIEKHYGAPQDIEWVLIKNKFYIVQTRPITTL